MSAEKFVVAHYPKLPYTVIMTHEESKDTFTHVQEKFLDEYLKDPSDGGAAYLRANPKLTNKKSASVAASKLLKLDKFQRRLKEKADEMLGPVQARILKNVEFWLEIRDGTTPGINKGKLVPINEVLDILADHGIEGQELHKELTALDTVEVVLSRTADRMKASESLAKWMQMFVEKKEVSVTAQVQIVDDI